MMLCFMTPIIQLLVVFFIVYCILLHNYQYFDSDLCVSDVQTADETAIPAINSGCAALKRLELRTETTLLTGHGCLR